VFHSFGDDMLQGRCVLFSEDYKKDAHRFVATLCVMHPLLQQLATAPADPIFAIAQTAKAAGPGAIDGTVGVFLDEDGRLRLFPSVRSAVTDLAGHLPERSFGYPPLLGLPEYRRAVERLLFGDRQNQFVATMATVGGTGALAIQLRLLKLLSSDMTLIVPVPTWANHRNLWRSAGYATDEVPYLRNDGRPSVETIIAAIDGKKTPAAILLHVGCHNPTGIDVDDSGMVAIAAACARQGCIPLLDFAYQGFKDAPVQESRIIEVFAASSHPTLICWSASKNHSLYGERTGVAAAVVPDADIQKKIEGHYQILTRGLHSAAASFGQSIVAQVQEKHRDQWEKDLADARDVMQRKRSALRTMLPEQFHASLEGYGMFAMLPLRLQQVHKLRERLVFLTDDGRINIAGIPERRIDELVEHIRSVL
jgi:aromatic-amino-acid transaminase